eukprot:1716981-Alexandrium_andersonii.AAC.1
MRGRNPQVRGGWHDRLPSEEAACPSGTPLASTCSRYDSSLGTAGALGAEGAYVGRLAGHTQDA